MAEEAYKAEYNAQQKAKLDKNVKTNQFKEYNISEINDSFINTIVTVQGKVYKGYLPRSARKAGGSCKAAGVPGI